ncbi:MAG: tRNA (adenosine(37)-N6)-dimethylallyltransferase MiaA [Clostridia bacterium]|nr:tRNA (adenosine(37)-N6)-dimethylallyltransferase MiaA [Clostridia bacterium]
MKGQTAKRPKIVCIVGPTASGKTAHAIDVARKNDGEIVSCDSMQIYKYMDIGTAKPTQEERQAVPHHMIDFADPNEDYSVADFVIKARLCIDDIISRGKLPVLCGGTGLYIDSVVNQIEYPKEMRDDEYRAELWKVAESEGNEVLHNMLREIDEVAAENIHPNNTKRVIRALEICKTSGMTKTEADKLAVATPVYDAEMIGLNMDRARLYDRINRRVDMMIEEGLLDEVKRLIDMGVRRNSTAMQAIGYKELLLYIDGKCSLDESVEKIKQESRRYAKRQLTWFKRNKNIVWIEK